MTDIVIDVESAGPCPGLYPMVSLAAVVVEPGFSRTFKMEVRPRKHEMLYVDEAYKVIGITREQHLSYPHPNEETLRFAEWLESLGDKRLTMWSDNPAYDWQFVNYYLWMYAKRNPLGFSARRIGDLYCGMKGDLRARWKHLRDTPHTHDPLDDARGNAEALMKIKGMIEKRG